MCADLQLPCLYVVCVGVQLRGMIAQLGLSVPMSSERATGAALYAVDDARSPYGLFRPGLESGSGMRTLSKRGTRSESDGDGGGRGGNTNECCPQLLATTFESVRSAPLKIQVLPTKSAKPVLSSAARDHTQLHFTREESLAHFLIRFLTCCLSAALPKSIREAKFQVAFSHVAVCSCNNSIRGFKY